MELLKLAVRNLTRSKRRNIILGIAIAFGFFVVTAVDGLASGAVANLEYEMTQLLGGTVFVAGGEKVRDPDNPEKSKGILMIRDHDYIARKVDELGINYKFVSHYTQAQGQILFNGKRILTQTFGRDFSADKEFIDTLSIVSGNVETLYTDPSAIIISQKTADTLKAEVGDTILYTTQTIYGQNEVGEFTVALITRDSNFLTGLWTYVNIETLNSLIGIPQGGYNFYSIYLKNSREQNRVALKLQDAIEADGVPVCDLRWARANYPNSPDRGIDKQFYGSDYDWEGTKYGVESMNDAASQLKTVVSIVHTVTTIILLVILLIAMVGVSNTYRMVLYERIREIGTMRALGMSGRDTGRVFTLEAVVLSVLGAAAGFLLAILVMLVLGIFKISNPSVDLFLRAGHITFELSPAAIFMQYLLMIILTALAVRGTAKNAARMTPAEALRTVK